MIRRTLREWQRIGYGDDDTTIPTAEADRIAAVAARSSVSVRSACPACVMEWVIVSTIDSGHLEVGDGGEEGAEEAVLVGW